MSKPKILIVEDENILAEDIKEMVQGFGYSVSALASDAEEALAWAAKNPPNLVLMDIMLKGKMQGIETAQRLRSLYNIPVVYLTAYADDKTLRRAKITEPFGYIIKPFDERDLRTVLEMALYKHQMEMKVRASEERYRGFFDQDFSGHFISQPDGKLLACNPAFARMLGFKSVEQALKSNMYELYDTPEKRIGYLQEIVQKKKVENCELELIRKDGKKVSVISNAAGHFNEDGKLVEISGFLLDITERKLAEEALRRSEEKYRTLFEESKDAIFISARDGQFLDINPAGVALLGYDSKEELLKVDNINKLSVRPQDYAALTEKLEKDGFVKDYELTLKRKDGQYVVVHQTATIVRDEQGRFIAIRGILRDVSEKKRLQEQLLQAQKMETIGTLAGGVAHDFNNLLTAIIGNADLGLHESQLGTQIHESFTEIRKAAIKASDLTDQLLSFSRRQALKRRYLDLNKNIEDLLKMLRRIVGEDIEIKVKLEPALDTVFADPGQLQQVLMNLVTNARDAMPEGGKIFLETANVSPLELKNLDHLSGRNYVKLTVKDTGCGIAKEHLTHIFEPFFTTKPVGKGTGLGLAVVYGVVKQHEGHIQVTSKPGKGVAFEIFFPSVPEKKVAMQEDKRVQDKLGEGETILIVEDDETVRNVGMRILNGLGYKVLIAKDGAEALSIFKTEHENIHLVLMDVVMPLENGPEIYKKMASIRAGLPVIFVTGYDVNSKIPEFEGGAEGANIRVLQKPYTKNVLANTINELLGNGSNS
jgi:PAS domain S-box-containing protein